MIDTMPVPLRRSDEIHLNKIQDVIRYAHSELDMKVTIGASANVIGNSRAADYSFENRPYFSTELRLNPAIDNDMHKLISVRRALLEPLKDADGFWILDSDPGGYPGSSHQEFVEILKLHRNLLDELRSGMELIYWVWMGWHRWEDEETSDRVIRETLSCLPSEALEPWGLLICTKRHFAMVKEMDFLHRVMYFPYNIVEDEPSFPWTGFSPRRIQSAFEGLSSVLYPRGVMANSQTHALQLPHLYLFTHFTQGGQAETINLDSFSESLIPGSGGRIADAWRTLAGSNTMTIQRSIESLRSLVREKPRGGQLKGLLFGDTGRFVEDIVIQLELKKSILELGNALDMGQDPVLQLADLYEKLIAWVGCHGYRDWYYGPFREILHPLLKEVADRVTNGESLKFALDAFQQLDHEQGESRYEAVRPILNEIRNIQ
jgi:hypothetical protein